MMDFPQLVTSWYVGLRDDVFLLAAAWLIAVLALWSAYRIVRTMSGSLYRLGFLVATVGYLVATLLFISPPNVSAPARGMALATDGAVASDLTDFDGDVFFTDATTSDDVTRRALNERIDDRNHGRRTVLVSAANDLSRLGQEGVVTVFGAGMQRADWFEQINPVSIEVSTLSAPEGFQRLDAPAVIEPGDALRIEAEVTTWVGGSRRVEILDASGDTVASSRIDSTGRVSLEIDQLPVGQHVFRAAMVDEEDGATVSEEPVAILVRQPVLARVLVLQSAPSFESRFMVRWLEQSGAQVALRNQVSQARFVQRFINREAIDLTQIGPTILTNTDLVVIDGRALAALSETERAALLNADSGHGVVVTLSDREDATGLASLSPTLLTRHSDVFIDYRLSDFHANEQTLLQRFDHALDPDSVLPLIRASDGSVVVGKLKSAKHIVVSLVADSYRMAARGDRSEHARLWSVLVNAASRPVSNIAPRSMSNTHFVGQRSRWCVFAGDETATLQVAASDGQRQSLQTFADRHVPLARCAWFWPQSSGWLTVSLGQSQTQVFVYPRTARSVERAMRARSATQSVANASPTLVGRDPSRRGAEPVSRRWLLLTLLLFGLLSWGLQRLGQPR